MFDNLHPQFQRAITAGTLSADPESPLYFEAFMFMGCYDDGAPRFKHRETRCYLTRDAQAFALLDGVTLLSFAEHDQVLRDLLSERVTLYGAKRTRALTAQYLHHLLPPAADADGFTHDGRGPANS